MAIYLGDTEIGGIVDFTENLDTELTTQEEELAGLEAEVNELSDKPKDMLQARVDSNNSCYALFYGYEGTDLSYIDKLDTSRSTGTTQMFYNCSQVTNIPTSNFDTKNVIYMQDMFYNCKALTSLDVSNFNTINVANMSRMFRSCERLTALDLSNFDTSNVTDMSYMFEYCKKLTDLDLSNFNTGKVIDMNAMFSACSSLTSIDLSNFNTSKVTNMHSMFNSTNSLETLDLSSFDTSNVTNMYSMFNGSGCVNVLGKLNVVNVTTFSNMFTSCTKLKNVTLLNIKKNLSFSGSKLLTNETLINTFKELWDLTGSTSQKLTLSTDSKNNIANIYVKLVDVTEEMLVEDQYAGNKKPCVVCESTDEGAMTLTEYAVSKNWSIA